MVDNREFTAAISSLERKLTAISKESERTRGEVHELREDFNHYMEEILKQQKEQTKLLKAIAESLKK